ncbi:hypothetical protein LPJ77_001777 [Coemansia sp. RSA 2523]|nr:hypothetical protein LPJ58_005926 [Coemansia sp. RSA 1591]KAJ1774276.1 hypothetical protein LPJ67_006868 [Coemansia sp. RSA 1938]KAJ1778946.1 hypothetical protein LPJ54_001311 [Coemansia sp. RSA 1824]KAJ1809260.1 hypothetical protein LPJ77_001777 [Coemansia sp. RSA 2523]KAJ2131954.1 hypothetical protein GGF48_001249 [Coemansia sp. RSA 921]KAJ2138487.1 hypothetical protein GGH17_001089 [Coemansia sp. RSA 788]KAJ2143682.1 hypothetical protein J3F82_005215 [Coemansia sp. RSA 637]KAJ2167924.1
MAGRVGAHMQLQNRLQGLRSSIQAISDIADDTVRVCTVAGLDLEELGETDSAMQVEASLRKLLDAQHQLDVERSLVTRLATEQDMADNAEAEYLASWEQSMATYNEQSDAAKYGKNTTYKEFREQLWEVRHDGEPMPRLFGDNGDESDEDLVIAGARMNYRCPVTTSWLVDPVTSKVCNHSYSKDAIVDYIRGNRGACACPVGGCSRTVRAQDLVPDKLLERKVARHLRQLESDETAAQYTVVQ